MELWEIYLALLKYFLIYYDGKSAGVKEALKFFTFLLWKECTTTALLLSCFNVDSMLTFLLQFLYNVVYILLSMVVTVSLTSIQE